MLAMLEIPQNPRSTVSRCEAWIVDAAGKEVRHLDSAVLPVDDLEKMKELQVHACRSVVWLTAAAALPAVAKRVAGPPR